MNVASIMAHKVATVGMDDSLKTVRIAFEHAAYYHVLVVKDRKLVGVISDSDLPTDKECDSIAQNKKAYEIMNRIPVTVDKEASIEKAGNLLLDRNVTYLPVLSSQGVVEGIVNWRNILKFLLKK